MVLGVGVALGGPFVVVEGDARREHVNHGRAAVAERRLEDRQQLLLVSGERPRDERRAELDCQRTCIDRRQLVGNAVLGLRTEVCRRRELPLREPVAAVVFDDVDDWQVPAHQVHELPDADRARITVAAHADRQKLAIGEHGAGADRRHPAVHGVEAVGRAEKVRRALAGAANPRQLDHLPGIDAHLVERFDNALGNRVVPAPGTERRLAAAIGLDVEPDSIRLLWSVGCGG